MPKYSLSRTEMETHITWDAEQKIATFMPRNIPSQHAMYASESLQARHGEKLVGVQ